MSTRKTGMSRHTRFHLRLGCPPETPHAHQAVRRWSQRRLDAHNDPARVAVSQWLQREVITALVETQISSAYTNWLLDATPPPPATLDPS